MTEEEIVDWCIYMDSMRDMRVRLLSYRVKACEKLIDVDELASFARRMLEVYASINPEKTKKTDEAMARIHAREVDEEIEWLGPEEMEKMRNGQLKSHNQQKRPKFLFLGR